MNIMDNLGSDRETDKCRGILLTQGDSVKKFLTLTFGKTLG